MLIAIESIYSINDNWTLVIGIYGEVNNHWRWPRNTDVASKNPASHNEATTTFCEKLHEVGL